MKRILLVLALFISTNAHAGDAQIQALMGLGMPGALATQIDAQYGSAVPQSLIPSANNTYDVGSEALKFRSGYFGTGLTLSSGISSPVLSGLAAYSADMTANFAGNNFAGFTTGTNDVNELIMKGVAGTGGPFSAYAKSRATDGSADTIVQSGDTLATIASYGADGVNFRRAAQIVITSDGTPGASDMPGAIDFQTTPDGNTTPVSALKLSNAGNATFAGTLIGTGTSTIGWTVTSVLANTACSSRCTTPAVFGFGLTTDSAFPITGFFDGSSASSDICLCAGAS
jgi:hypothetical protein